MLSSLKLDKTDFRILEILQHNAKITNAQLAQEIGLSPAPTLERVKKLENSGLIKSYHAELDRDMLDLSVTIFLQVTLNSHKKHQINAFVAKINDLPEVTECHHITGTADFLLKVLTKDIKTYQELILTKLIEIEEIGSMQSMVVLSTYKEAKILPLA